MCGGKRRFRIITALQWVLFSVAGVLCLPGGATAWDDPLAHDGGLATSRVALEEGPRSRVGQIFLVGNQSVPQNLILRSVPFAPGAVFAAEDLRQAERNLVSLNLFEIDGRDDASPMITVLGPDGKADFKDILISVREKPTARLQQRIAVGLRAVSAAWMNGLPAGLAEVLPE